MARTKGQFNFSANLEVKKQAPLDARQQLITYAELTQAATWQDDDGNVWLYDGLVVPVEGGQLWVLTNKDNYQQATSWKRVDAGEAEGKGVITLGYIAKYMDSPVGTDVSEVFGDYTLAELFGGEGKGKIVRFTVYDETDSFVTGYQPVLFAEAYDELGLGYRVLIKSKIYDTPDVYFHELFFSEEDGVKKLTKNTKLRLLTDEQWTEVSEKVRLEDFSAVWDLTTESTPTSIKNAMPASLWVVFEGVFGSHLIKSVWVDTSGDIGVCPVSVVCTDEMGDNFPVTISKLVGDKLYVLKLEGEPGVGYSSTAGKVVSNSIITLGQAVESVTAGNGIEVTGTATAPVVSLKLSEDTLTPIELEFAGAKNDALKATIKESIVASNDKVLKFNYAADGQSNISTQLGLTYDSGTKKIKLTGKDNAVVAEIDATDFIKDGMVDSVELEGNNLIFTFNTDSGKEEVSVDLSKFIDVYSQGNGITISGKAISVNPGNGLVASGRQVAISIKGGDKYLGFDAGALASKGIDEAIETAITKAFGWHDA